MLFSEVSREGDSSGWERSSLPVTMRIVEEDSRELLRVITFRLFPTRSVGGTREGVLGRGGDGGGERKETQNGHNL